MNRLLKVAQLLPALLLCAVSVVAQYGKLVDQTPSVLVAAGATVYAWWYSQRNITSVGKEKSMSTVISKDGTKIAYERIGKGPAVILVDGAMSSRNFGTMKSLAERLSKSFSVYTFDRRARGESGDVLPYAVEREIEDIETLINKAGGRAHVYGISSGGVLALKAAAKLNKKITGLAIYEAPFTSGDEAKQASLRYKTQLAELLKAGKRGDAVALFLGSTGMPSEMIAGMRQAPHWPMMEALAHTLAYDAEIMGDGSLPAIDAVKAADMPTLILDGGASPAFMHKAADALADIMPNAKRKTLESQTHQVAPEALAPILEEFFMANQTR